MIIVVRQTRERFVERLDFVTSLGHGAGAATTAAGSGSGEAGRPP